jgi:hypothetical protein
LYFYEQLILILISQSALRNLIHHIIYISTATHLMTDEELSKILEESRQSNSEHEITGMLLYIEGIFASAGNRSIESASRGRFMQILEGKEEEVEETFSKIKQDERHFDIITLKNSAVTGRYFESWQMGFKKLSGSDLKDSSLFFNPDIVFAAANDPDQSNPLNFLRSFYIRGQSQQTVFRPQSGLR